MQTQKTPRWKLHRADWDKYQLLCEDKITIDLFEDQSDPVEIFSNILYSIAEECIPKTSNKIKKRYYPWFDDDCKDAIKTRKRALRVFNRMPSHQNLTRYKIEAAKARRTIRCAKKESWRQYVSKLNSRTPIKQTWSIIRKISGKHKTTPLKCLDKNNNTKATSPKEIANLLGQTFEHNSSSDHYTEKFQRHKRQQEQKPINFKTNTIDIMSHSK